MPGAIGSATQYEIAQAVALTLREIGVHDYDITGHSLGGSLAQYAALLSGNPAVVFNSAALNCRLVSCDGVKNVSIIRVDTVGLDPRNFVTTVGSRLKGTQFGSFILAGFGSHDMLDVLAALRRCTGKG